MIFLLKALLVSLFLLHTASAGGSGTPQYVGRSVCAECHAGQEAQWAGSHHDLAMQVAGEKTVLGDFDDASLTHAGVTSSFFRKDGKFMVRTESGKGNLEEYELKYTFGFDPLQQYLVEFPGGRLQALSLAWDARPEEQGGQRWFHLYPDEKIEHDDELHWTRASQNWNSMCADCHSTGLRKNYDPEKGTFSTTWSEIDVSCEACHGPGSSHVDWARRSPGWERHHVDKGLMLVLDERKDIQWSVDPRTGNATRNKPRTSEKEIEMCARCHSRRSPISEEYVHGERLLDHYLPRTLDEQMYYADGQIREEVYVYGSFVQSRMYHAGVTCSDCHEPHSLKLHRPGNGVCLQCHQAKKYDRSSHHFHASGSEGASCVECHMPSRTYMVVDPRHDHSIRIPRPDLSVTLGTPNACNNCHADKDPKWAENQVLSWYQRQPTGFQRYAEVMESAFRGTSAVSEALGKLVRDAGAPDIARATALAYLPPPLSRESVETIRIGLADADALVRFSAIGSTVALPPNLQVPIVFPLLEDPVRAVRIEAARVLAGIPSGELSQAQRQSLDRATGEYVVAQQVNAERPEAQTNLGNLFAAQGRVGKAESAYRKAIELNPAYIPAYVNLADLRRSQGNESGAEESLRRAIEQRPGNADAHHALGLSLVRQKRLDEAIRALRLAAKLAPNNVRYTYVYAVALNSTGKPRQAVMVLQGAHSRFPEDTDVLGALVAFHRDMGNQAAVRTYTGKLDSLLREGTQ